MASRAIVICLILHVLVEMPHVGGQTSNCPNDCNLVGTCDPGTQKCTCPYPWDGSYDCTEMSCPKHVPYFRKTRTNAALQERGVECSGVGLCDRATGTCVCEEGYTGTGCERTKCPSITDFDCNSRGKCISLGRLSYTEGPDADGDGVGIVHTAYGYDRIYGCFCDWGWAGPDCSLELCPRGKDPAWTATSYYVATLTTGAASGVLAGNLHITILGQTFVVAASASTTTAAVLDAALEGLGIIGTVTVTRGSVDAQSGAAYAVTFTSWPQTPLENNFYRHDGAPNIADFKCSMHALTGSPGSPSCAWALTQTGNLPHTMCSSRGICDFSTGICACTENYVGSACESITYRYLTAVQNSSAKGVSMTSSSFTGDGFLLETRKEAATDFRFIKVGTKSNGLMNVDGVGVLNLNEGGISTSGVGWMFPPDPVADKSNSINVTSGFINISTNTTSNYLVYLKNTVGNSYTGDYIDIKSGCSCTVLECTTCSGQNALHFRHSRADSLSGTPLFALTSFGDMRLFGGQDSTTSTSGSLAHPGGFGVAKSAYCGSLHVKDSTASSSSTTGAMLAHGALAVGKMIYIGGAFSLTKSGQVDFLVPFKGVFGDVDLRDTGPLSGHDYAAGSSKRSSTPIVYFNSKINPNETTGVPITTGSSMIVTQTATASYTGSILKLGTSVSTGSGFEFINAATSFAQTNWTKEGVGSWYFNTTGADSLSVDGTGVCRFPGGILSAAGGSIQNAGDVGITAGGVNLTSGDLTLADTGAVALVLTGANDGHLSIDSTHGIVYIESVGFRNNGLFSKFDDARVLTADTTLAASDTGATVFLHAAGGMTLTLPDCASGTIGWTTKVVIRTDSSIGYALTTDGTDVFMGALHYASDGGIGSGTSWRSITANAKFIRMHAGDATRPGQSGSTLDLLCYIANTYYVTGQILDTVNNPSGSASSATS